MILTIKSREGLDILQRVYESYENTETQKKWEIESVNEDNVFTAVSVEIDLDNPFSQETDTIISVMSLELLRLKHMQYFRVYAPDIKNIYHANSENMPIPTEVMAVALDSVENSYYTNIISVAILKHLLNGRTSIDLNAFSRFNIKDFNKDFDEKIAEFKRIKKKLELGRELIKQDNDEVAEDIIMGNPFEIIKIIYETGEFAESNHEVDITVIGKKDGGFDVFDGINIVSRDVVESSLGMSFEVVEDETSFELAFESSMLMIIYSLIFLKTKVIYVEDKFNTDLKSKITEYLESAGAYPDYSPYILTR